MTRGAVDSVVSCVYTVPTEEPESDGTLTWDHTTVVTAEVVSRGVCGLGFTYGPSACACVIDDLLAGCVLGQDPMDVPAAWTAMVRAVRNAGRPGIASMAIAAVDIALWDLKAHLLQLPLVDVLGAARTSVPVYGSGGFTSLSDDDMCAQLSGWVRRDGMRAVKIKVGTMRGGAFERDVHRVELARAAVGPQTDLFIDANGAFGRKDAVRFARAVRDDRVTWFEEPVSSDDLEGLRHVRSMVDCDVAAGEYGYDLAYFEDMCRAEAVDVVQADVSRCAGITEWLRVAAVAAGRGLEISGHCAQSLHAPVGCAIPNLRHLEYFADHARVDRLLFDGVLHPCDGCLVPDGSVAGHGLRIADRAARYRVSAPR